MAKNSKGKLFYEVTREKPTGKTQILLMGGSVGAVVSFFIVSFLGSLYGIEMDELVFYFILSSILGFFVGGFLTWFFVRNFSKVVSATSVLTSDAVNVKPEVEPLLVSDPESVISAEEEKGQSVDFVFPELSPDK